MLAVPPADAASAQTAAPPLGTDPLDLSAKTTAWNVEGAPSLDRIWPTTRATLEQVRVRFPGVDGQSVEGFYPGPSYEYTRLPGWTPFYLYARDTATIVPAARYLPGSKDLVSAVEEWLRLQYADGAISATIAPDRTVDKATVVADEETSLILAAETAFDASTSTAGATWLRRDIRGRSVLRRLDDAAGWLLEQRLDADTGLIWRGHTTDWGDVKWEPSRTPTDLEPGDQRTASIYDQAIAYAAFGALARFHEAVGDAEGQAAWQQRAQALRDATERWLWQDAADRGFYRIHVHLQPDQIQHDFDEGTVVAIGNAAAVYYGLAPAERTSRVLSALERARLNAGAPKPGLTVDPPYLGWQETQMGPRVYQNGALWDWWGGRQVSGEFRAGYSALARQHLEQIALDWAQNPGKVYEWQSPWLARTSQDDGYAGAAGAVGEAVIAGLFGVDLRRGTLRITPRLGLTAGWIRVYEPASGISAAYRFSPTMASISVEIATNSPDAVSVELPLPAAWSGPVRATLDGADALPASLTEVGEERHLVVVIPSGRHRVDFERVRPSGERTSWN